MACKMVVYFNAGASGWSETYYHPANDPLVLANNIAPSFWRKACGFRATNVQLMAARFSLISLTNLPALRTSYLARPAEIVKGGKRAISGSPPPDVVSTTCAVSLYGTGAQNRKIAIRGLVDEDVERQLDGTDTPSATLVKGIDGWVQALRDQGFAIKLETKPPAGGLAWVPVSLIAVSTISNRFTRVSNIGDPATFPLGSQIQFKGIPGILRAFPRNARVLRVTGVLGACGLDIPYTMPSIGDYFPVNMYVCPAAWTLDSITTWRFERFTEHKTGRPFGQLRGRVRTVSALR